MRSNLNPLLEFFDGEKFRINQDYYLTNYLNTYKQNALIILDNSETIQQAYYPFKELTEVTLFNIDSCESKAQSDGIIAHKIFKYKRKSIIKNMDLMDKLVCNDEPNWKLILKTKLLKSSFISKYI